MPRALEHAFGARPGQRLLHRVEDPGSAGLVVGGGVDLHLAEQVDQHTAIHAERLVQIEDLRELILRVCEDGHGETEVGAAPSGLPLCLHQGSDAAAHLLEAPSANGAERVRVRGLDGDEDRAEVRLEDLGDARVA